MWASMPSLFCFTAFSQRPTTFTSSSSFLFLPQALFFSFTSPLLCHQRSPPHLASPRSRSHTIMSIRYGNC
uniref:Uncharacterized protein n=1 Tax=Manihot esculenta TaxID=3983 RepID=A0A2C9WJL2_MANES